VRSDRGPTSPPKINAIFKEFRRRCGLPMDRLLPHIRDWLRPYAKEFDPADRTRSGSRVRGPGRLAPSEPVELPRLQRDKLNRPRRLPGRPGLCRRRQRRPSTWVSPCSSRTRPAPASDDPRREPRMGARLPPAGLRDEVVEHCDRPLLHLQRLAQFNVLSSKAAEPRPRGDAAEPPERGGGVGGGGDLGSYVRYNALGRAIIRGCPKEVAHLRTPWVRPPRRAEPARYVLLTRSDKSRAIFPSRPQRPRLDGLLDSRTGQRARSRHQEFRPLMVLPATGEGPTRPVLRRGIFYNSSRRETTFRKIVTARLGHDRGAGRPGIAERSTIGGCARRPASASDPRQPRLPRMGGRAPVARGARVTNPLSGTTEDDQSHPDLPGQDGR